MGAQLCENDVAIGPTSACRFDFTIRFENSILQILPDALFLLTASLSIVRLFIVRHSRADPGNKRATKGVLDWLSAVKLFLGVLLAASQAALLATWTDGSVRGTIGNVAGAAAGLSLSASLLLLPFSYLSHTLTATPSTLITAYLFLRALFDGAYVRTLALLGFFPHDTAVDHVRKAYVSFAAAGLVVRVLLAAVEMGQKRRLLKEGDKPLTPEGSTSVWARATFIWLIPFMILGRKKTITMADLYPLERGRESGPIKVALQQGIDKVKRKEQEKYWLLKCSLAVFGWTFFVPILPRMVMVLCNFVQPLLVHDATEWITSYEGDQPNNVSVGWALLGAYTLVYSLLTLSTASYWEAAWVMSFKYRAATVSVLYNKALRLSAASAREQGAGAANSLMSVDVQRITESLYLVHELIAAVISVGLSSYLLYTQTSWAFFAPIVVILIGLAICTVGGQKMPKYRTEWFEGTSKRSNLVSSVFNNIVPVKLSSYEGFAARWIGALRAVELAAYKKFLYVICWTSVISNTLENLSLLAALGSTTALINRGYIQGPFTLSRIFTIVTIVQGLNEPINLIGQHFPTLLAAWTSLGRIQDFLSLDEYDPSPSDVPAKVPGTCTAAPGSKDILISGQGASFAWSKKAAKEPFLKELTFEIERGSLVAVIGPVGCGKSAFLHALLSEMHQVAGSLRVHRAGRCAFVSDSSWVTPDSVRSNILFDRPLDPVRLDKVLRATALDVDVARFPQGLDTPIGDRGIKVSGGQRARIALARALYSDADVVYLDDVFSALDAHTEKHVFEACFDKAHGLLRGKTTVLVTHAAHLLSATDKVLVLKDGRIMFEGSFEALQDSELALALEQETAGKDKNLKENADPEKETAEDDEGRKKEGEVKREEEDEMVNRRSVGWRVFAVYLRAFGRATGLMSLALVFGSVGIRIAQSFYLQRWQDTRSSSLVSYLKGLTGFTAASTLVVGCQIVYFVIIGPIRVSDTLHARMLHRVLRAPLSFFQSVSVGRIVARFSQDIMMLDWEFPLALINFSMVLVMLIGSLLVMFVAVPWLAISAPILLLACFYIQRFYLSGSSQVRRLEQSAKTPLYEAFELTLSGLPTIRAYGASKLFEDKVEHSLDRSQQPYWIQFACNRFLQTSICFLSLFIAFLLMLLAVLLRHSTTAGYLAVALTYLANMTGNLSIFLMSWTGMEIASVGVERVVEYCDLEQEEDDVKISSRMSSSPWPSQGRVEFKGFSLRYQRDLPESISDLNFVLEGGKKLGIVGRSGSGKSTAIFGLLRGVDTCLTTGSIQIDEEPVSSIPISKLRDSLSLVSQEPFLLAVSIRDNLDPDGQCTDDEIWTALQAVGLTGAIGALESKLDTVMSADAALSRGQRQLLGMARVLLRKRRVVILDEATSAMDMESDQALRRVIQTDLKGSTIISVAHRIATVVNFDYVAVMDAGRIVEFGTPKHLLADPDTHFAKLAASQNIFHV